MVRTKHFDMEGTGDEGLAIVQKVFCVGQKVFVHAVGRTRGLLIPPRPLPALPKWFELHGAVSKAPLSPKNTA